MIMRKTIELLVQSKYFELLVYLLMTTIIVEALENIIKIVIMLILNN